MTSHDHVPHCLNTDAGWLLALDHVEVGGGLDGLSWEYVAPAGACSVGRALDGRRLRSLSEVYQLLPGFGENPCCTRRPCGCTALPVCD